MRALQKAGENAGGIRQDKTIEGEHVKQLINGKLYDTENSTELARWSNKSNIDDLWLEEILYKTAEGDYFICGTGGSLTPYAKHDGTNRCAGCDIRRLTRHEAAIWAALRDEKNLLDIEFSGEIENTRRS